ncbi:hypothetical protein Lal_00024394 [Lupinus albus]|nr:hypothetical protein Lal_00024394 [Lupinus albus]
MAMEKMTVPRVLCNDDSGGEKPQWRFCREELTGFNRELCDCSADSLTPSVAADLLCHQFLTVTYFYSLLMTLWLIPFIKDMFLVKYLYVSGPFANIIGLMILLTRADQDVAALIRVLREVIAMNMSIFQLILSFLAFYSSKSKISKWLKVAKLMQKGVQSCEESSNELQCVDAALSTFLSDTTNVEEMQATRDSLAALENAIESLENGLENILRFLIKTRTSILNIMSQQRLSANPSSYPSFLKLED